MKMQYSCYHVGTIGHPNSSYITTKLSERLHVDATVIRSFQKELFSRFLPSPYVVHVNLAAGKPSRVTIVPLLVCDFIIYIIQNICSLLYDFKQFFFENT